MVMSIIQIFPWISLRFLGENCKVNCAVGLIRGGEEGTGPQTLRPAHSEERGQGPRPGGGYQAGQ
jgi:hypothetical protein